MKKGWRVWVTSGPEGGGLVPKPYIAWEGDDPYKTKAEAMQAALELALKWSLVGYTFEVKRAESR